MIKFNNEEFNKLDEDGVIDFIINNGSIIPYVSPFGQFCVIDTEKKEEVDMSQKNAKKLFVVLQNYLKNHKNFYSALV